MRSPCRNACRTWTEVWRASRRTVAAFFFCPVAFSLLASLLYIHIASHCFSFSLFVVLCCVRVCFSARVFFLVCLFARVVVLFVRVSLLCLCDVERRGRTNSRELEPAAIDQRPSRSRRRTDGETASEQSEGTTTQRQHGTGADTHSDEDDGCPAVRSAPTAIRCPSPRSPPPANQTPAERRCTASHTGMRNQRRICDALEQ